MTSSWQHVLQAAARHAQAGTLQRAVVVASTTGEVTLDVGETDPDGLPLTLTVPLWGTAQAGSTVWVVGTGTGALALGEAPAPTGDTGPWQWHATEPGVAELAGGGIITGDLAVHGATYLSGVLALATTPPQDDTLSGSLNAVTKQWVNDAITRRHRAPHVLSAGCSADVACTDTTWRTLCQVTVTGPALITATSTVRWVPTASSGGFASGVLADGSLRRVAYGPATATSGNWTSSVAWSGELGPGAHTLALAGQGVTGKTVTAIGNTTATALDVAVHPL